MLKELKKAMSLLKNPLTEEDADHLQELIERYSGTECRYASSMLDDIQNHLDREATQEDDFSEEIISNIDNFLSEIEEEDKRIWGE